MSTDFQLTGTVRGASVSANTRCRKRPDKKDAVWESNASLLPFEAEFTPRT